MTIFQLLDISSDDISIGDNKEDKEFVITLYGKTNIDNEGFNKNIVCHIHGFRPFFYIKVPDKWPQGYINSTFMMEERGIDIWHHIISEDIIKSDIMNSYEFYGYHQHEETNTEKKYNFIKLEFITHQLMKKTIRTIKKYYENNIDTDDDYIKWFIDLCKNDEFRFESNLYESNIHPILRFIHAKNIKTSGWIELSNYENNEVLGDKKRFNVELEYDCLSMNDIKPIDMKDINKFIIASFDIECDSSHGDFPNPIKDFRKLAIELSENINEQYNNCSENILRSALKDYIEKSINGVIQKDINIIYLVNGPHSDKSLNDILDKNIKSICELFKHTQSSKDREKIIKGLTDMLAKVKNDKGQKLEVKGDPVIQIGTVFHKYGDKQPYDRSIVVIGPEEGMTDDTICDDLENINVYRCDNERELLLKWKDLMLKHNPDYITGYNIFGFDFDYIIKRVSVLFKCDSGCRYNKFMRNTNHNFKCPSNEFYRLGRLMKNSRDDLSSGINMDAEYKKSKIEPEYYKYYEKKCNTVIKRLGNQDEEEDSFGSNTLKYIHMDGRIIFDVQNEVKKNSQLDSYKLDNVASHFMRGKIISKKRDEELGTNWTVLKTNNIGNLKKNDYISFSIKTKYGEMKYNNGEKFKIIHISNNTNDTKYIYIDGFLNYIKKYGDNFLGAEWCMNKDDVPPQELFRLHKEGGPDGRAKIAKYCIMDCELCIHLLLLLDFIPNNMGMSNVCYVPQTYIFLRGQGIKVQSIVTKICSENNIRVPTLKQYDKELSDNSGFEGAIVLKPKTGIYLNDPIVVLDYASLYPSSIIEKNLSHDTYLGEYENIKDKIEKMKWVEEVDYNRVKYNDYKYVKKPGTSVTEKIEVTNDDGTNKEIDCVFLTKKNKHGIISRVLDELLGARKATKKLLKNEQNEDKKKVLDGLQLAYKVTANSVYGQMGAKTSSIAFKKIAACTTAIGRDRIYDASDLVKEWAEKQGMPKPVIVYGDTDSIFVSFSRCVGNGIVLKGHEALKHSIDCGIKVGDYITKRLHEQLKKPQVLEYEKTFFPFILISKKRYTGEKYEFSADDKPTRTSMGLVTKRRDNAPIVKYVFGNMINRLMHSTNINETINWLEYVLQRIIDGKEHINMFILSKTLNSYYKNPNSIAHKVLADRIGERDPGNKPKANDRIPYLYVKLNTLDANGIIKEEYKQYNDDGEYNLYKVGARKGKFKQRKILQGEMIEHPDYMNWNDEQKEINYSHYISNQIMNPVKQVLDIMMNPDETKQIFEKYI